jgi:hypothetical protein
MRTDAVLFDKSGEVGIPIGSTIAVTQLLFLEKYETFSCCYHMTAAARCNVLRY